MVNNIYNRVLMIDDDEDLSFVISDMLESYGYEVTCAENSERAFIPCKCSCKKNLWVFSAGKCCYFR